MGDAKNPPWVPKAKSKRQMQRTPPKRLVTGLTTRVASASPSDVIKAIHTLVAIDIATGREATLDSGCDFYSSPTLNVDGSKLAWLSWQHPNMPWTSTYLNVAGLDQAGTLTDQQIVQGGSESIFQPQWSGREALLHFRPQELPIAVSRLVCRVSDAGPWRWCSLRRGRRPKAAKERTRG